MKIFLALGVLLLWLGGCTPQSSVEQTDSKRPAWILNPSVGGKVGAVGVAGRTYDQKESTKRKLAITRALDELSLQQGVRVVLNISKKEVVKNDNMTTSMDTQSNYKANAKVTAHIEQVWEDPLTQELYVWMVIN